MKDEPIGNALAALAVWLITAAVVSVALGLLVVQLGTEAVTGSGVAATAVQVVLVGVGASVATLLARRVPPPDDAHRTWLLGLPASYLAVCLATAAWPAAAGAAMATAVSAFVLLPRRAVR